MLQNNYKFNQSSVSLEIIGLPDYSINDNKQSISIISQWKLSIVNRPEIEGNAEHLKYIIKAFYNYSMLLLLDQETFLENKLIDIIPNTDGSHTLRLKSSKPDTKPLNITIGNAEFSDIINCLDQLKDSEYIKIDFKDLIPSINHKKLKLNKRDIIFSKSLPALMAFLSITILSFISINFYDKNINPKDKVTIDANNINWRKY